MGWLPGVPLTMQVAQSCRRQPQHTHVILFYKCKFARMRRHTQTYTCTHTCKDMHTHTYKRTHHTHIVHACMHAQIHTCIYEKLCTHIICMCRCTHKNICSSPPKNKIHKCTYMKHTCQRLPKFVVVLHSAPFLSSVEIEVHPLLSTHFHFKKHEPASRSLP
jgi:hypothetical protein